MKTKQPSSTSCYVCGVQNPYGLQIKFYNTEPGEVVADYIVPAHFQGYPGIVHGGVIAAMLDEVSGRSLMPVSEGETRFMVTAKLSIRYRKPVPVEQPLKLVGRAGADNGRVGNATGAIYGPDGTLLAEAEALMVNIPSNLQEGVDELEAQGWRVYPDEEEPL